MARVISICNQKGGVGKCLAPGTPVLLSSGELVPIDRVFEKHWGDNLVKRLDSDGGVFIKPKHEIGVFSLDDELKIVEGKVEALYRGRAEKLLEIRSSRGKTVKVTPTHPFLSFRNGKPGWVCANDLEEGDFIAVPRQVEVRSRNSAVDLIPMVPDEIYLWVKDKDFVDVHLADILSRSSLNLEDKILFQLLQQEEVSASKLYATGGKPAVFKHLRSLLAKNVVSRRRRGEYVYSLIREGAVDYMYRRGFSVRVFKECGWDKNMIAKMGYRTRFGYTCIPINPIWELDRDLAIFLAIILAEGYLGPSRIVLFHTSPEILDFFSAYCRRVGLRCQKEWVGNQWKATVNQAGTLMKILHEVGEVPIRGNRKSFKVKVPGVVLRAPREILAAYLGAYIGCEGYIAKDRSTVEVTSASFENIIGLQYAFLRFGINSTLRSGWKWATNSPAPKKRMYHFLTITGSHDLRIILEGLPILIEEKVEKLKRVCELKPNTNVDVVPGVGYLIKSVRQSLGLRQRDVGIQGTITDYEDGSNNPSRTAIQGMVATLSRSPLFSYQDLEVELLDRLGFSDVFWERVTSKTSSDYDGYVYDLTVGKFHNFIAGQGGLVVHNTTTAVNLGSYLAALGRRVLLVDFDPQANASSALGYDPLRTELSVYHGIINAAPHEHVIRPTALFNFHLVPAAPHLAGALVEFVNLPEREYFLRKFINRVRHSYDYVLVDLPPSLSLLTVNGLVASDEVLVPVQAEYYSLEGLGQLLQTIDLIRNNLGHNIKVSGAVLTMYNKGERLSREVATNLRKNFPYTVFNTEIPRSVALAEAPSFSKPVMLYRPDSIGALAYRNLAAEVMAQEKELIAGAMVASQDFGNFNVI